MITNEMIQQSAEWIRERAAEKPVIGMILGSGLGELAEEIENKTALPYKDIPYFPTSTVAGHKGQLVIGQLEGKTVAAMQGRFHFYEGYSMQEITFPVRVMRELGCESLIVTNACGGMNEQFQAGDLMIIDDHINFTGTNPLIGENLSDYGPRFPDMSQTYTEDLRQLAFKTADKLGDSLQSGVYAAVSGPTYMSAAELIMLRKLGGDTVGMSTVPEATVARHMNMNILGISCITDMAIGETIEGITHEEVMAVAEKAKPRFKNLVRGILQDSEKDIWTIEGGGNDENG
ncbi:purine-nucleoside phosphorylase [Salisediminibacterium halotolerans]|uniref:Purine nucleoside phosphorylase n=1 Tax=Salisediminibacterium halotolerans TaxID=517425 RepID=A0A1H9P9B8_9BACI|nr:purine-nucleoside phosphorylase [Salisediminibacterium haloalkalitolerans]SER44770.1 purine-nucleoside phosphorylase [Salisediminibacterium haloalkalitolerans]